VVLCSSPIVMLVVEQNGLAGPPDSPAAPALPYSPASPCTVPFVVEGVIPPLPVADLPYWDLSSSLLLESGLVAPVLPGCNLSRSLLELGLAELSFALKSIPPTLI
jgi:hypothetical protein